MILLRSIPLSVISWFTRSMIEFRDSSIPSHVYWFNEKILETSCPTSSLRLFRPLISYQEGMTYPPFKETGWSGAWGKIIFTPSNWPCFQEITADFGEEKTYLLGHLQTCGETPQLCPRDREWKTECRGVARLARSLQVAKHWIDAAPSKKRKKNCEVTVVQPLFFKGIHSERLRVCERRCSFFAVAILKWPYCRPNYKLQLLRRSATTKKKKLAKSHERNTAHFCLTLCCLFLLRSFSFREQSFGRRQRSP